MLYDFPRTDQTHIHTRLTFQYLYIDFRSPVSTTKEKITNTKSNNYII